MKKLLSFLFVLLLGAAFWYFFIKDYNYLVRFQVNHSSGTVYSTINNWLLDKHPDIDSIAISEREFPNRIVQEFYVKDSVIQLDWRFNQLSDSTTKVKLYSKDALNSTKQNFNALLKKNDFVRRSIDLAQNLNSGLSVHEEDYKISSIDEVAIFPETFCACVNASATIFTKANSMMDHINVVMGYINQHDLELVGDPMLQVLKWNKDTEDIEYDFCFPIEFDYQLPKAKGVIFKTVGPFKALQTNFNGNYRISDRAWYTSLFKAEQQNLSIIELPVEIYRNDPHVGAGELDWVAEVYMPLK